MSDNQDDRQDKPEKLDTAAATNSGAAAGLNKGAPAAPESGTPPPKKEPVSSFYEDVFFGLLAVIVLALWGETTRKMLRATYYKRIERSQGELPFYVPHIINRIIGTIVAFGAGIFVGYPQWSAGVIWYQWLWHACATAAVFAGIGWPLFHVTVGKFALRFREQLWSRVSDGSWRYYGDDERRNPPWFSRLLLTAGYAGSGATGLYIAYLTALYVHAHQAGWSWLGSTLGVVVLLFMAVVAAVMVGCSWRFLGFKFTACWLAVAGVVGWRLGAPALISGLAHNLTGGDWGTWGYVPGGFLGLILGGASGAAAVMALKSFRMRAVATASALAATAYLVPTINGLTAMIPLGPFAFLAPALPWLVYGVCILAVEGFAFPIVHIFITHALIKLANVFDLMDEVYGAPRGGYREFPLQVAAIAGTVFGAYFGAPLVGSLAGWTNPLALYAGSSVASFVLVYLLGYALLDLIGSAAIGFVGAGFAAKYAFAVYAAHGWPYGIVGCSLSAAGIFALFFMAVIPLALLGVRNALMGQTLLMVRNALVTFREELFDNLLDAADKAYGDTGSFARTSALWTTLCLSLCVLGGAGYGMWTLGFAHWLAVGAAGVLALAVFTLAGQFFLRFGKAPLYLVFAGAIGVAGGVLIHGGQPVDWGWYRYILSVIGGIAVAAVAFGGPLAWWYLFWKALYEAVAGEGWLLPVLSGMYDPVWARARGFRDNFMSKYRYFQQRLAGARERFNERYAAMQSRLNERSKKK